MIQIQKSSLQEVNEILLRVSGFSMVVPANVYEYRESVAHGFKFAPFYDYTTSYDAENYYAFTRRTLQLAVEELNQHAVMYVDKTHLHFHYLFGDTLLLPPTSSFTLYYEYKLYTTEVK